MPEQTGTIRIRLFDGAREPYSGNASVLVRVRDRTRELASKSIAGSTVRLTLPVREPPNNFYSVIVHADGFRDAGVYPVEPRAGQIVDADLMLVRNDAVFHLPKYRSLENDPLLRQLVANGRSKRPAARYQRAADRSPASVAALLTIGTAVRDFRLADGKSPLDASYYWEVRWNLLQPDRFWAWVDKRLVDEIKNLQAVGAVAEEQDPAHWHPGIPGRVKPATRSWKQVRFDVSNVQFTFHEQDTKTCKDADGRSVECVVVEPDMDLYRDLGAHGLLEVVPNLLTGNKTNALDIYRLRWMATRQEGVQPDFAPPVTVA
jgi:hypothetical protein